MLKILYFGKDPSPFTTYKIGNTSAFKVTTLEGKLTPYRLLNMVVLGADAIVIDSSDLEEIKMLLGCVQNNAEIPICIWTHRNLYHGFPRNLLRDSCYTTIETFSCSTKPREIYHAVSGRKVNHLIFHL